MSAGANQFMSGMPTLPQNFNALSSTQSKFPGSETFGVAPGRTAGAPGTPATGTGGVPAPAPNTPGIVPQPPNTIGPNFGSSQYNSPGIGVKPYMPGQGAGAGGGSIIGGGQFSTENPLDANLNRDLFNYLNSQVGQGVQPFNLSALLGSSGQATQPGTLTAPNNQLLQQLQAMFSGGQSSVPGGGLTSGLAGGGAPGAYGGIQGLEQSGGLNGLLSALAGGGSQGGFNLLQQLSQGQAPGGAGILNQLAQGQAPGSLGFLNQLAQGQAPGANQQLQQNAQGQFAGPGGQTLSNVASQGVNAVPAWQQMLTAQQHNIDEGSANLKEQFNFAGNLAGTPFGNAATDYATQTAKDQNALLGQLQLQGITQAQLPAAQQLQAAQQGAAGTLAGSQGSASGLLGQLQSGAGGQLAGLQSGAASTLGGAQQQASEFGPQLQLSAGTTLGGAQAGTAQFEQGQEQNLSQYLQGLDQSSIQNLYNEFIRTQSQSNPTLGEQFSAGTTFAPTLNRQTGQQGAGLIGALAPAAAAGIGAGAGAAAGGAGTLASILAGLAAI